MVLLSIKYNLFEIKLLFVDKSDAPRVMYYGDKGTQGQKSEQSEPMDEEAASKAAFDVVDDELFSQMEY